MVRDFGSLDLLISLSDMPDGWQVSEEPHQLKQIGTVDSATVQFTSDAVVTRNGAHFSVSNYGNSREASRVFKKMFVPRVFGSPPLDWSVPKVSASQYEFGCYDYEGQEPLSCKWTAQYEEFIVEFFTWIVPDYMSIENLEHIIISIDNRMTTHLYGSTVGTPSK